MSGIPHLSGLFEAAAATATRACPDCPAARLARSSVFDDGFWTNLLLVSLPVLALAAISALLYRIGGPRRSQVIAREIEP